MAFSEKRSEMKIRNWFCRSQQKSVVKMGTNESDEMEGWATAVVEDSKKRLDILQDPRAVFESSKLSIAEKQAIVISAALIEVVTRTAKGEEPKVRISTEALEFMGMATKGELFARLRAVKR
jgi:hypothetical protein